MSPAKDFILYFMDQDTQLMRQSTATPLILLENMWPTLYTISKVKMSMFLYIRDT